VLICRYPVDSSRACTTRLVENTTSALATDAGRVLADCG